MDNQQFILYNADSFIPEHIFECGQCFRWNKEKDNSYIGIFEDNIIRVKKIDNNIIFEGLCSGDIKEICYKYFDLDRDYNSLKKHLASCDENLKQSIKEGNGIRILNQNLWETIITFIISANNNIPRIKTIIEKLSRTYGRRITWEGTDYYTFPTVYELKNITPIQYRKLGLGFRDIRIYETVKKVLNNEVDIDKLKDLNTLDARNELLKLSGVGPKVADCILLFSTLKRFDVFPIDVWVRRVMNNLYIKNEDENKVKKEVIEKIAEDKFGSLKGLAQQYLFFNRKDIKMEE